MLHVEKWAAGRSFLIAFVGPQAAATAQDISESFAQIKSRRLFGHQFPLPPLPAWFPIYRSHHYMERFLKAMFSQFSPFGPETVEFTDTFMKELRKRGRNKIAPPQVQTSAEDLLAAKAYLQNILTTALQELSADFSEAPVDPSEREAFLQFWKDYELEMSFFMLVHIPCWLLYKTSPTRLYRKARSGDTKALNKLLRLDALMIHDPSIGRAIQRLRYQGKKAAYRKCLEAPLLAPQGKISQKRMKYVLAGFLSSLAHLTKQRLTEREIRDLFHDANRDISKDTHSFDLDVLVNPSTFAKAVERERKSWLGAMKSDKKN